MSRLRPAPMPAAKTPSPRNRSAAPKPHVPWPPWAPVQLKPKGTTSAAAGAAAPNRLRLPEKLKAGVEALSGLAMDDVRVHPNSPEPAKLGALAYAQGSDIHLGPGQERHLPHEAWHVVQQKQGRVTATSQRKGGVGLNDDHRLEGEAEVMGAIAASTECLAVPAAAAAPRQPAPVQRFLAEDVGKALSRRLAEAGLKEGFAIVKKWRADDEDHGTVDEAFEEIERLVSQRRAVAARKVNLFERLKRAIADHDDRQVSGQRNTELTQLLATATQLDNWLESQLENWPYDDEATRVADSRVERLDFILRKARSAEAKWAIPEPKELPTAPVRIGAPVDENVSHLPGMRARLASEDRQTKYDAIGGLRGADDPKNPQARQPGLGGAVGNPDPVKGAILHQYIRDNRRAILDLVEHIGPGVALFSLERGGSFLSDLISDFDASMGGQGGPNIKIPKSVGERRDPIKGEDVYYRELHHLGLVKKMMDVEEGRLFKMMKGRDVLEEPPVITITIAETAVSGSSVNTLLTTLDSYHELVPQTQFDLLIEKQTIKEDKLDPRKTGGLRLSDPGINPSNLSTSSLMKVRMFIAQTTYILGEDVDYQISYSGRLAGEPLVIFDEHSGSLIAARLSAKGMLPRDLLRMLVAGAFDRALDEIFA